MCLRCLGHVNHFTVSLSKKALMGWKVNKGPPTQGKVPQGGEDGEKPIAEEKRGGQNYGCIVVCFPNISSGGSGTGQLNIQTAQ